MIIDESVLNELQTDDGHMGTFSLNVGKYDCDDRTL